MFIKKQRMIELQNVNLRLRAGGNVKKRNWYLILGMLLLVQLIAIFYFGSKKAGFHYDEYYSYYSSNVSIGLVPTDREWKPGSEIADEFRVLPGQRFQYGTVTRMQTYDVHPPFYYLLLHTVCSLFPGRFSKWSGIGLNIVLFVLSWSVLAKLTRRTGFRKALRFCHQPKKCDVCGRGGTNSESHRNSAGKIRRNAGAGSDFPGRF
mgnify:CR=1 FL=1